MVHTSIQVMQSFYNKATRDTVSTHTATGFAPVSYSRPDNMLMRKSPSKWTLLKSFFAVDKRQDVWHINSYMTKCFHAVWVRIHDFKLKYILHFSSSIFDIYSVWTTTVYLLQHHIQCSGYSLIALKQTFHIWIPNYYSMALLLALSPINSHSKLQAEQLIQAVIIKPKSSAPSSSLSPPCKTPAATLTCRIGCTH